MVGLGWGELPEIRGRFDKGGFLMVKKSTPIYLVHSNEYLKWVFDASHPTQGRRFDNGRNLLLQLAHEEDVELVEEIPRLVTTQELQRVHAPHYIEQVLTEHRSGEWSGQRSDLSHLASLFVGGTLFALELLLQEKTKLAVHFPGAKHHAQYDQSSGFCVFNDFAIAAEIATRDYGLNVLILDIDGHHGDGVENLLARNSRAVTFSIHERGIFPGTGLESSLGNFYNFPLPPAASDLELLQAVDDFIQIVGARERIWDWTPDLLFITCGADGHEEDPLTNLEYSVEGYVEVARRIRDRFPDLPILLGGAGGYLPDTRTPEIWAKVALELAKSPSRYEERVR